MLSILLLNNYTYSNILIHAGNGYAYFCVRACVCIDTLTLIVIPNRFPEGSNSIDYSKVTLVALGFSRVAALMTTCQ